MVEIHLEVTNDCLLECKHCSSEANSNQIKSKISGNNIIDFINRIEDINLKVIFTGGEPLLYGIDNLAEIFKLLKSHKSKYIEIGLFTTGVVENEIKPRFVSYNEIETLSKSGLSFVYLSIYSSVKTIHEYITNEVTFDLTIETLKILKEYGIRTNVNYVLSKFSNLNSLITDFEFLKELGVNEIRILRLIKHGRAVQFWDEIGISYNEQIGLINDILETQNSRISVGGMPHLSNCQENLSLFCYAGEKKYYIDIQGDIYPCAAVKNNRDFLLGNIHSIYDLVRFNSRRKCCLAE